MMKLLIKLTSRIHKYSKEKEPTKNRDIHRNQKILTNTSNITEIINQTVLAANQVPRSLNLKTNWILCFMNNTDNLDKNTTVPELCMCKCQHTHTHTHLYTKANTDTDTETHTHTHTHTCTQRQTQTQRNTHTHTLPEVTFLAVCVSSVMMHHHIQFYQDRNENHCDHFEVL